MSSDKLRTGDARSGDVVTVAAQDVPSGFQRTAVGVIPAEWEVCQLGSLGTGRVPPIKAGPFGSSLTKAVYVQDGYKVYGQEQVIRGDHLYGDYYITPQKYRELESCAVHAGDILLSLVGTVGRLLVVPEDATPGIINPRLVRLSFDESRVDPHFFHFLFTSEKVQSRLGRQAQGGTMGVLNAGNLRPFRIQMPSLAEQRAISEVLSDVDELLGALDALIAKKQAIKQAAMQQLLTGRTRLPGFSGPWDTKRLGDIGRFLKGRGVKRYDAQSGPLACVRYGEIYTEHNDHVWTYQTRISHEVASTATRLESGDLLFAGSGETKEEIGKCAAIVLDTEAYAGSDIVILRPNDANPLFFGYALNTPAVVRQKARLGQGDAVAHISAAALAQVTLDIPPNEEQSAVALALSDMDAEIVALEARHDKTRQIKQGMMQQLLTGRTRLVEPTKALGASA